MRSLGFWYAASLRDTIQVNQIREDTVINLNTMVKTLLSSRLKL